VGGEWVGLMVALVNKEKEKCTGIHAGKKGTVFYTDFERGPAPFKRAESYRLGKKRSVLRGKQLPGRERFFPFLPRTRYPKFRSREERDVPSSRKN